MVETAPLKLSGEFSEAELEYRSVDRWAVAGLIVGLLSPLSLIDTPGWLVPMAGIGISGIALERIRRDSGRIGRGIALAGLALSITFLAAPAVQRIASYFIVAPQARPIAEKWFELLSQQKPERALLLTFMPTQRQSTDEAMWFTYLHDEEAKKRLKTFVKVPVVRTLLALGERADVRFYKTEDVGSRGSHAQAAYLYTVTYTDDDGKKTFFVRVILERKPTHPWLNPWHMEHFEGGIDPR